MCASAGIYSLERLMRESPLDRVTVVQVLSDFVREHAPLKRAHYDRERGEWRPVPAYQPSLLPTSDVQAAVTVIGRRPDPSTADHINFSGADLSYIDTSRGNFDGADLEEASLVKADLTNASLDRASFRMADLTLTTWETARARKAIFSEARMEAAYLKYADLSESSFFMTITARSGFTQTHLEGADFSDADLRRTGFSRAYLTGAKFKGARLEGAQLHTALGLTVIGCARMDGQTLLPKDVKVSPTCTD
ncbi:pentapeptide repeat-containing protein [Micromonospora chalcea]